MAGLPDDIRDACATLFDVRPLETAMRSLVGSRPSHKEMIEEALRNPALKDRPELAAGLWLYVDDLERSHAISQGIDSATGSFWHGIMHRREGDFSNSRYWMRRAAGHPLLEVLQPDALVDAVALSNGRNLPELVERQRAEWKAVFEWCAGGK